jgi:hypothetical protein
MLDLLKGANLALAFALELAMLAGFAVWALSLDGASWIRWGLAAVLVAAAIGLWAVWAAPNSATRLGEPALTLFKIALFGLAALAFFTARQTGWAAVFGALAAVNLLLASAWGQL